MSVDEDGTELGLVGQYGVLVVPAPIGGDGAWLVTLGRWDSRQGAFTAESDGPLFEERDEAMHEAERLLEWLSGHQNEDDVPRAWDLMRQEMARERLPDGGASFRLRNILPGA